MMIISASALGLGDDEEEEIAHGTCRSTNDDTIISGRSCLSFFLQTSRIESQLASLQSSSIITDELTINTLTSVPASHTSHSIVPFVYPSLSLCRPPRTPTLRTHDNTLKSNEQMTTAHFSYCWCNHLLATNINLTHARITTQQLRTTTTKLANIITRPA